MASSHCRNPFRDPATASGNGEPRPASETSLATLEQGPEPGPEPGPAPAPVLPSAPGPDPAPAVAYTEVDLQRLLRICNGAKEPSNDKHRESPFKARFLDLYT